jgi:predicted glycoside hydrolase/deacetylase ChbG (UPF0249 family)
MTVRIIVNADDLGVSEVVNEAIFRAMERHMVTSATLLANGPEVARAARTVPRFSDCSFGVHLNLTEFKPVCAGSSSSLSKILNEQGCFNGNSIRQVPIGMPTLKAIYREWCAQIEYLISLGVQPSHLDGHHHVHTIPQLLPVLAAMRRRYRINRVRISRNMYDPAAPAGRLLLVEKRLYNSSLGWIGFRTAEVFTELEVYLRQCADRPPRASVVELMTHPGSTLYSEETRLLAGDWTKMLSYTPVLVNYRAL